MDRRVASCVLVTGGVVDDRGVLRALHERDPSRLLVPVVLELRVVLAAIADLLLCIRVLVRWTDETTVVGLASLVVHSAVLV